MIGPNKDDEGSSSATSLPSANELLKNNVVLTSFALLGLVDHLHRSSDLSEFRSTHMRSRERKRFPLSRGLSQSYLFLRVPSLESLNPEVQDQTISPREWPERLRQEIRERENALDYRPGLFGSEVERVFLVVVLYEMASLIAEGHELGKAAPVVYVSSEKTKTHPSHWALLESFNKPYLHLGIKIKTQLIT
ncbi:hypothetical protein ACE6H2_010823 [Prunus campanulata]